MNEVEEKFGLIISDYSLREKLKYMSERYNILDFKILSHWSRSIISNNYNLNHPDYLEYKKHYNKGDVSWLEKGKTCVNMKKYKSFDKEEK